MIDQLVEVYLNEETWHQTKLPKKEAWIYFATAVQKGRILARTDGDRLLGYVESWRISFDQFGRLLCQLPFDIGIEDIEHGNICYVANIFVRKEHRRGDVFAWLKHEFFKQNIGCEYLVGEALRKKTQPVKVFKMQESYKKWIGRTEEALNGA